jgi:hypothetical protein
MTLLMHKPALVSLAALVASTALAQQAPSVAGRWQYLQPPDQQGEVLDLSQASGRWRGVFNGLERAGEHGLFYFVVEVENLVVEPDGRVHFEVGYRSLFAKRPPLSRLGGEGDSGFIRGRMHFSGRLDGSDLVLRCEDKDHSCPDSVLRFTRRQH